MQSIATYFGLSNDAELAWAHRVHSAARLASAMGDASLHVLEADVQFGPLDATPLVGDGKTPAEVDVASFVLGAMQAGKAFKLDFHSAGAIEPTLAILKRLKPAVPVILHADIFNLLGGKGEESLEPEQFIRQCSTVCPHAVLSLGWSLKRAHDDDGRMEDVIIQQLAAMLAQRLGPVSYAVEIRAGYTPRWERGAALMLDPLDPPPRSLPAAANVVDMLPRIRRVA